MNSYFSTFITGFSQIVREALKKNVPDIKIDLLLDGLIVYRTETPFSEIEKLRYLNNTYSLIHSLKDSTDRPFSELRDWIKESQEFGGKLNKLLAKETHSLKIIFVEKNQYIHLDSYFTHNLSNLITGKTHITSSIQQGEQELWFLVRKEGYSLIGLRLTRHPDYEKTLKKGELKPELANLLCLMSDPSEDDIFLDPFAGSGAIPLERSKSFPFRRIIASDQDLNIVESLNQRFRGSRIEVYKQNALDMKTFLGKTQIDKIVTDPPWGLHVEHLNIDSFYQQIFEIFYQSLKPEGLLIWLVTQSIDMDRALAHFKGKLKEVSKVSTLVNGQKASVYKLEKEKA